MRLPRICGAILAVLALAACDTQAGRDFNQSTRGLTAFLLGTGADQEPPPIDPNAPPPRPGIECPPVSVREGTETFQSYVRGHDGDPAFLIYQGTISRTARECAFQGADAVTFKIGVAGRVLLGPQGQPGTVVQLPVRLALVKPGGEAVWSELRRVSVQVPAGASSGQFAEVAEGVSYRIPPEDIINNYVVYAGFDAGR